MNLAIIQARMGSTRLPGKVMMDLVGKPVLWHVIDRVKSSKFVDKIVVATTISKNDLQIVEFCAKNKINVYTGSEDDVLDRYYQTARLFKADNVIRITADCPLHDPYVIDDVISKHLNENNDYTSNTLKETYPDGLDCEVMTYLTLEEAWRNARLLSEREHVTQYIIKNEKFKMGCLLNGMDRSSDRWTLDTDADYEFIKYVYNELYINNQIFCSEDIYGLLDEFPHIREINKGIVRNEGLIKSLKEDCEAEGEK